MDPIKRLNDYIRLEKFIDPHEVEVVPVTLELAKQYDELPRWKGERSLSKRRMAYLIDSIRGVSLLFEWIFVRVGGADSKIIYRVNGQNTSRLFVERPAMIRKGMRAALIGYHCEDETDVALLYSTIDSRITSRTVPEINNSYRSGHIRLEAYSKTFVTKCASGLRYSLYGINHSQPLSPVEHGELLLQNIDFIEDAGKIIGMKSESTQHMWRSPVVFAMHRTYLRSCQVDKDLFFEFWTEVRSGAKVRGSMPDLLREHLLRKQVRGSNIVHASGLIDRASMARMCIEVWNRWRKGSKLKSLKSIKMKGKFPKAV